jgi:hypothetical protein
VKKDSWRRRLSDGTAVYYTRDVWDEDEKFAPNRGRITIGYDIEGTPETGELVVTVPMGSSLSRADAEEELDPRVQGAMRKVAAWETAILKAVEAQGGADREVPNRNVCDTAGLYVRLVEGALPMEQKLRTARHMANLYIARLHRQGALEGSSPGYSRLTMKGRDLTW